MAPIRSKLMELSYSDPKFQIRLTGYADTVIIDSGAQQMISAIRFGGYPEVVRALSDAIYGGASVELKQDDTTLFIKVWATLSAVWMSPVPPKAKLRLGARR